MSKIILWLPKKIYFYHYVLLVNLKIPRSRQDEIDWYVELMHEWLFGKKN